MGISDENIVKRVNRNYQWHYFCYYIPHVWLLSYPHSYLHCCHTCTRCSYPHLEMPILLLPLLVLPIACGVAYYILLMPMFRESDDYKKIQREKALDLPPKPPQKRSWRGSTVAPFARNNMLTLYSCPSNKKSKYFVQVMHNEIPVPLPGCKNSDFCPFEDFKERIVNPHLGQDYHSICSVQAEVSESSTFTGKLWKLFHMLFPQKKNDAAESDVGNEL